MDGPVGRGIFHGCAQTGETVPQLRARRCERLRTPNETVVLLFLSRHAPQQDTATDIAAARGISKALVARSVDGLHRRGFLESERDENDRRVVHLRLCGEGIVVAERLKQTGIRVAQKLRENITDEELQAAHRIMCKMQHNLDALYDSTEGMVK